MKVFFIFFLQKIKLVCTLLSLPIPTESANPPAEEVPANLIEEKLLNKLVLVGDHKSGTSTIFKQVKYLFRKHDCIS